MKDTIGPLLLVASTAAIVLAPLNSFAVPVNSDLSQEILLSQRIAIGTIAKAELVTPLVWSDNSQKSETRGIITLSEPIVFENGAIAIEEGSSLIVEVTDWERSGLVSLSAIAIDHAPRGKLQQQAIPPGTLLIKAKNHKPLIAKTRHLNDNSSTLDVLRDVARTATRSSSRGLIRRTANSLLKPRRSRNRNSSRDLIYQIDAETEVSIFVNNSLDI